MHDSTTVHLHIIQQSTVFQAIWIAADKANSSWIPAWQGDCAWNHAKHMSSWLDVHSSVRYTHDGVCIFYVCVCACVSVRVFWTMADGLLTHSHYTGIMLLLAPSGWLRFLYLTHTHYILLSTTHGVFDYDSVIKKSLSFTNLENDYPLNQSSVLFTFIN